MHKVDWAAIKLHILVDSFGFGNFVFRIITFSEAIKATVQESEHNLLSVSYPNVDVRVECGNNHSLHKRWRDVQVPVPIYVWIQNVDWDETQDRVP